MLIFINKLAHFVLKTLNLFSILTISLFISFTHFSDTIAQPRFTEITSEAGIDHHYLSMDQLGGGAAFFDMDNDGDEDLWISGGVNRDVLYENDGKGNFVGNRRKGRIRYYRTHYYYWSDYGRFR